MSDVNRIPADVPHDTLIRRIKRFDFPYEFGPREAVLPELILMPADFEHGLDDID
jgi:hypothetical protein